MGEQLSAEPLRTQNFGGIHVVGCCVQIKDRVFIVTGASSGIGLAAAKALSANGAKLALLARSGDLLKELAEALHDSLPITVDVTDLLALRKAVADVHGHFGAVDGLINNAGRSYAASVEEIDPAAFDEIFHLNVLGPIVAMQAVIPLMRVQGGGSIVNINSGTAFMTVPPIQRLLLFEARASWL